MKKILTLVLASIVLVLNTNSVKANISNNEIDIGDFRIFWSSAIDLDKSINAETIETYHPSNRKWVGLPTIARTPGGRLWIAFMTGGFLEPDTLNYNVLYYSDDNGETWSEEFLIIEAKNENRAVYDPRMFMDDDG